MPTPYRPTKAKPRRHWPSYANRLKRAERCANTRWLVPTRGLKLTRKRVSSAWLDGYAAAMRDARK